MCIGVYRKHVVCAGVCLDVKSLGFKTCSSEKYVHSTTGQKEECLCRLVALASYVTQQTRPTELQSNKQVSKGHLSRFFPMQPRGICTKRSEHGAVISTTHAHTHIQRRMRPEAYCTSPHTDQGKTEKSLRYIQFKLGPNLVRVKPVQQQRRQT